MNVGQLTLVLAANLTNLQNGLNQAAQLFTTFANNARARLQAFEQVAIQAGVAAGAIGLGIQKAISSFGEFEAVLNTIQAVSGATEEDLSRISEAASHLGVVTKFSAKEAADAFLELAKAGFTVDQQMAAINGTLDLAAAGGLAVGQAAEITAGILQGFGLQAEEATRVVDNLAQAANTSAIDVTDVAMTMKYLAPVARASNQSLEEMTGVLAALGNNMIKGEQAGTMMRTALAALQAPSSDAAKIMSGLGIVIQDTEGKMLPLSMIIDEFRVKMEKKTEVEKTAAISTIFGREALSGMLALLNTAPSELQRLIKAQEDATGAGKNMADGMNRGINYTLKQIASSVEAVVQKIGGDLAPAFNAIGSRVIQVVNAFGSLPNPVRQFAELVIVCTGAVLALVAVVGAFSAMLPALALGFAAVATGMGPVVIALGVLAGGIALAVGHFQEMDRAGKSNIGALRAQEEHINSLAKRYEELAGKAHRSKEEEKERLRILAELEKISPSLVTGYDNQGRATDISTIAVNNYNDALREKIRLENESIKKSWKNDRLTAAKANMDVHKKLEEIADLKAKIAANKPVTITGPDGVKTTYSGDLVRKGLETRLDAALVELVAVRKVKDEAIQVAQASRDKALGVSHEVKKKKVTLGKVVPTGDGKKPKSDENTPQTGFDLHQGQFDSGEITSAQYRAALNKDLKKKQDELRKVADAELAILLTKNEKGKGGAAGEANKTEAWVEKNKALLTPEERAKFELKILNLRKESGKISIKTAEDEADALIAKAKAEMGSNEAMAEEVNILTNLQAKMEALGAKDKDIEKIKVRIRGITDQQVKIDVSTQEKKLETTLQNQLNLNEKNKGGLAGELKIREANALATEKLYLSTKVGSDEELRLAGKLATANKEVLDVKDKIASKNKADLDKFTAALGQLGAVTNDTAAAMGVNLNSAFGETANAVANVGNGFMQATSSVTSMQEAAPGAVAAMQTIGEGVYAMLGPIGLAIGAVVLLVGAIKMITNSQEEAAKKHREDQIKGVEDEVKNYEDIAQGAEISAEEQIKYYQKLSEKMSDMPEQLKKNLNKIRELEIKAIDEKKKDFEYQLSLERKSTQQQIDFYMDIAASSKASADQQADAVEKVYDLTKKAFLDRQSQIETLKDALIQLGEEERNYANAVEDLEKTKQEAQLSFLESLNSQEVNFANTVISLTQKYNDQIEEMKDSIKDLKDDLKDFDEDTAKKRQAILDKGILARKKTDEQIKADELTDFDKKAKDDREKLVKQISDAEKNQANVENLLSGKTEGELTEALKKLAELAATKTNLTDAEKAALDLVKNDKTTDSDKSLTDYHNQQASFTDERAALDANHKDQVEKLQGLIDNTSTALGVSIEAKNQLIDIATNTKGGIKYDFQLDSALTTNLASLVGYISNKEASDSAAKAAANEAARIAEEKRKAADAEKAAAEAERQKQLSIASLQQQGKDLGAWAARIWTGKSDKYQAWATMDKMRDQLRALGATPQFEEGGLIPDLARFNGIQATLHRGETILPRDLSQGFLRVIRSGTMATAGGISVPVTISGNYLHPQFDLKRLSREVSQEVVSTLIKRGH